MTLRKELIRLSRACGHEHPSMVPLSQMEILNGPGGPTPAFSVYGYEADHQKKAQGIEV
jgi:hypothetical protein